MKCSPILYLLSSGVDDDVELPGGKGLEFESVKDYHN